MNFIALIGIVNNWAQTNDQIKLNLKVDRHEEYADSECDYEEIVVQFNSHKFHDEFNILHEGDIIGVKGKVMNENGMQIIYGEKLQIF
ncbi:MAG: hypothetical protein LBC33_02980 [Mycoplasmataceae bacterium]|jgi:lysyl-tRNA synthetase class II|nr:hypothetical protein [Mycoplasmataceae bacterium]